MAALSISLYGRAPKKKCNIIICQHHMHPQINLYYCKNVFAMVIALVKNRSGNGIQDNCNGSKATH